MTQPNEVIATVTEDELTLLQRIREAEKPFHKAKDIFLSHEDNREGDMDSAVSIIDCMESITNRIEKILTTEPNINTIYIKLFPEVL